MLDDSSFLHGQRTLPRQQIVSQNITSKVWCRLEDQGWMMNTVLGLRGEDVREVKKVLLNSLRGGEIGDTAES